ncbi:MAG: LPS export ABC transporter periplasmic protein LptC [Pseudomonadota bacterium]
MSTADGAIGRSTEPRKTARGGALESLTIKKRTTGEKAAARSRMVRRLRIALPALALVLVLAFWRNMSSDGVDDAFLDDFKSLEDVPTTLQMANPQFPGRDAKGRPYLVSADAATRGPEDDAVVVLERPRAVTDAEDERSAVVAARGRYHAETKRLDLDDGVEVRRQIGGEGEYVLNTPAATVLLDENRVETDRGVRGVGPQGNTLIADTMTAYQDDNRVVFEGNVRLTVHDVDALPASETDAPGADEGEDEDGDGAEDADAGAPASGRAPSIRE